MGSRSLNCQLDLSLHRLKRKYVTWRTSNFDLLARVVAYIFTVELSPDHFQSFIRKVWSIFEVQELGGCLSVCSYEALCISIISSGALWFFYICWVLVRPILSFRWIRAHPHRSFQYVPVIYSERNLRLRRSSLHSRHDINNALVLSLSRSL